MVSARKIQSAAGAAHSKTWRRFKRLWPTRQGLGVRRSSAAFDASASSHFVRFVESLLSFFRMHGDHEPVGRVTPCAPQFGNAQTARRGLTSPTFRFMESPLGFVVHWDHEPYRPPARPRPRRQALESRTRTTTRTRRRFMENVLLQELVALLHSRVDDMQSAELGSGQSGAQRRKQPPAARRSTSGNPNH